MSEGNDHNTSAGDKYSLPLLCEVKHGALCKVKADTVAEVLGLGTQSVPGLAEKHVEDTSQKWLLSLKDFQRWAILKKVRAPKAVCRVWWSMMVGLPH